MKSYEFTGKTVEKAEELGLKTLGKNREDVDIQVVSLGGFLRKAKIIIKVEDEKPKTFVKTTGDTALNLKPIEEKTEKVDEKAESVEELNFVETKEEKLEENKENVEKTAKNEQKIEKNTQKTEKTNKNNKNDYVVPTPEELEEKRRKFAEKHFANNTTSVDFVKGLLEVLNINAAVTLEETRESSNIVIETEDAGKVIGYRGDSISAIQYLANVIEEDANKNAKRVTVDCADYRKRREENLRSLAIKVAGRVSETGKAQKLEPMTAYERRIIHTELQNYPTVETHSEGAEPFRRIVVTKKK